MEPVAALSHRLLMHGPGWSWHRSHHRVRASGAQRNDLFPAIAAVLTVMVLAAATASHQAVVVAAGVGVSGYGVSYAVVHDVCVHGRLSRGRPMLAGRWLRWVASGHGIHHRFEAAPYGFLLPMVPARHRAAVAALRSDGTVARHAKTS